MLTVLIPKHSSRQKPFWRRTFDADLACFLIIAVQINAKDAIPYLIVDLLIILDLILPSSSIARRTISKIIARTTTTTTTPATSYCYYDYYYYYYYYY